MKKQFTWLHISDLHFAGESDDRDVVLEAFFDDIKKQIQDKYLKLDCVFFSGDIAQSGIIEEYYCAVEKFFKPLLNITGICKDKLFVVPGNHDVNWDKLPSIVATGIRGTLVDRQSVNEFLKIGGDRKREFAKFDAYAKFVESFFKDDFRFNNDEYFFTHIFNLHGVNIAVLGLNSAWMSACYKNEDKTARDQGKLLIGDIQLRQALKTTEHADIHIALLHHPVDWLDEEIERSAIETQLEANCDFVLHGHLHRQKPYFRESPAGQALYIPAGTLYQSYTYPNGYNFVQFDLETRQGNIFFRRFENQGAKGPVWMKDIVTTGEDRDGVINFNLSKKQTTNPVNSHLSIADLNNEMGRPDKKRILMIEDRIKWISLITKFLQTDYIIDVATSYVNAKESLDNHYDAVIVNLCLDGDSDFLGVEILNTISKKTQPIPCVVVTGSNEPIRGIFERYPFVQDVFPKGNKDGKNFPQQKFLEKIKQIVGD